MFNNKKINRLGKKGTGPILYGYIISLLAVLLSGGINEVKSQI